MDCAIDQRHRFKLTRDRVMLRLCLQDDQNQPYVNTRYRLSRVGTQIFEGTTDGQGRLEQSIPADAQEGELTLFLQENDPQDPGYTFALRLGDLNPVEEISGVQARLNNLGFDCGTEDGTLSEETREVLRTFQQKFGLPVSGEIDDATRNKLHEL